VTEDGAPRAVPRDGRQRALNLAALLLVGLGIGLYLYALWRMNHISGGDAIRSAGDAAFGPQNLDRWHALNRLSTIGIGITVAGLVAVLGAALRHALRARRFRDHGLSDHS